MPYHDRFHHGKRTPHADELADARAMRPGSAFGTPVQWYLPERATNVDQRRWLWCCLDCRVSESDLPTAASARASLSEHRAQRCPGVEPDWLVRARKTYRRALDERRRRTPRSIHSHALPGVTRLLASDGDPDAAAILEIAEDV